ncbi:MAG: TRAP transporter small permease [Candidatus Methylomirabilales bacterium]
MLKEAFDNLIEGVCAILMVALAVVVFIQVFNRFILQTPLAWSEDLAMLLYQWVVFVGAALGVKRMRHFGIELVVRQFPEHWRHRIEMVTPLVMLVVAVVMVVQGYTLLTLNVNRTYATMNLSYTWAFLPIPLGGVLIIIYLIQVEAQRWRQAKEEGPQP